MIKVDEVTGNNWKNIIRHVNEIKGFVYDIRFINASSSPQLLQILKLYRCQLKVIFLNKTANKLSTAK